MATARQRRSGSATSASGATRKHDASPVHSKAQAVATPQLEADALSSPFPLFDTASLISFGITLGICLAAQAVFSIAAAQLPMMRTVAQISRNMKGNWEFATLLSWKIGEITVGWFAGFNALEMALFTFVTNFPHTYFLWTFYLIDWAPLTLTLTLSTVASFAGFSYARLGALDFTPLSGIGQDAITWASSRLLSAGLYAVPMILSLNTWLPVHLAVYWNDLETLAPARSTTILQLAPAFFLLGHSTVGLILNPIVQHKIQLHQEAPTSAYEEFDPATATLGETVAYNMDALLVWRHVRPALFFLIKRTAVLTFWTIANVAFHACATVEGCDTTSPGWFKGPALWGTLWGTGAVASGLGMGWVGGIL